MKRVISGGQTGADRGGLDGAMAACVQVGGRCPRGRRAEDGRIPDCYPLRETESADYRDRTAYNVEDSDGTVVFVGPSGITSGCRLTLDCANSLCRPCTLVELTPYTDSQAVSDRLAKWMLQHDIRVLNVAGSRESKAPGIQARVAWIIQRTLTVLGAG